MATLAGVIVTAHGPFCYIPPSQWNVERAKRPIRGDVPFDTDEQNEAKGNRIQHGFAVLREQIAKARPDVLVVFGNDQRECFDFTNYPSLSILGADDLFGITLSDATYSNVSRIPVKGDSAFAASIVTGLLQRGFDPAFSLKLAPEFHGVPHAVMNPLTTLTDQTIPVVPILLNCYYAPQVSARRSYEAGRALREIVAADASDKRVVVIGSGGLWHTSGGKNAYIDETFDRALLAHMQAGDIAAMARHFDDYAVPPDDTSQQLAPKTMSATLQESVRDATGLPPSSGPQGGTRETCCWIAAAAVAEGKPATLVDYVPVYSSPTGLGFGYWPEV